RAAAAPAAPADAHPAAVSRPRTRRVAAVPQRRWRRPGLAAGTRRRRPRQRRRAARPDRRQRRTHRDHPRRARSQSVDREHRRRVEQAVLPGIRLAGEARRTMALDSRGGAQPQLPRPRAPRLHRQLARRVCTPSDAGAGRRVQCRVPLLAVALGLSLLGGFGGLLVASSLLVLPAAARDRLVPWLVSYAVGALLGVAFIELLPQALATLSARRVFATLLGGILVFFVLEKLALWRHCHTHECDVHGASGPLVLLGDAAHNFMDGAVIGAAVLTSIPVGIGTALAYAFLDSMPRVAPYFLSFATASFLYVAMADLIPDLHRGTFDDNAARQVLLV